MTTYYNRPVGNAYRDDLIEYCNTVNPTSFTNYKNNCNILLAPHGPGIDTLIYAYGGNLLRTLAADSNHYFNYIALDITPLIVLLLDEEIDADYSSGGSWTSW